MSVLLLTEFGWFWCAHCGRSFPKGRSDAESKVEHDEKFPGQSLETSVLICDDCFAEIEGWQRWRPGALKLER